MKKTKSKVLIFVLSFTMMFTGICLFGTDTANAEGSILVDARSPEVYSGWTLGDEPGGHLAGAVNFSARWIDEAYPYDDELGYKTKDEAMKMALDSSGLTDKDAAITVYDTKGEEAPKVAAYLEGKGFNNVSVVQKDAADFVTAEKDPNFDMYVPAEVVKNISDFKLGKAELSPEAKAIVGDKKVKILHAEWYTDVSKTAYATTGHVPGAEPITTDDFEPEREQRTGDALVKQEGVKYGTKDSISWSGDYLLATDEKILELAKKYGIYKDDCIIVVGFEPMSTCKIALLMKYLGVENVHVMSGAYNQWPEEYGVEKTINQPVEGTDITEIGKPDVIDTQDEAAVMIKDPNCQLVDTRTEDEFKGLNTGYGYHDIAGRIPGVEANSPSGVGHSSSMYFYRNPDGTMRSSGVIRAMWADQNVDTGKHLSFFCGSGWRAAEETWDAWVMGLDNASMYNDGWQGWSNAERPFIDAAGNTVRLCGNKIVSANYTASKDAKDPDWVAIGITESELKADDVLVDVGPADRFEKKHYGGSVNVPVNPGVPDPIGSNYTKEQQDAIVAFYDANIAKGRIVIICNGGNWYARNAMQALQDAGRDLSNVTYLRGGAGNIAADKIFERKTGAKKARTMTTTIDMTQYPAGKVVEVWVPVPQTEDFQTISNVKYEAKTAAEAKITTEKVNGNTMLYLKWDKTADPKTRIATLSFDAERYEAGHEYLVEYAGTEVNNTIPDEVKEYATKQSAYVTFDGPYVQKYAAEAVKNAKDDSTIAKARAIYEWVINNLARIDNGEKIGDFTFAVEGCGWGETEKILGEFDKYGIAGGHCTDLNSTFVALCRANGIPAREMFGIRMNDDATGGQHCWAEFYLPGTGWVFADPADVLKAIKPKSTGAGKEISKEDWATAKASDTCKAKTEYFWGTVDENRIVLSRGRDVKFEPEQSWGVCNTFGYPAAEVDDQRLADFTDAKNFKYSIACTEIKNEPAPAPAPDNSAAIAEAARQGTPDASIPKVTSSKPKAAKKAVTVKWKKLTKKKAKKAEKMEIWVCPNKAFGAADTKIVTAGKSKGSKKVGGLQRKTKYYVKVRAIKNVGGVKHVGKWSKVKSIKTK